MQSKFRAPESYLSLSEIGSHILSEQRKHFASLPEGQLEGLMRRSGLSRKDKFVLRSRFRKEEDMPTFAEIGRRLGVTGERIKQREERALRRLNDQVVMEGGAHADARTAEHRRSTLETPVSELGLEARSIHCLRTAGINTIGKLAERSAMDLWIMKSFGITCLQEIVERLDALGLTLKKSEIGNYLVRGIRSAERLTGNICEHELRRRDPDSGGYVGACAHHGKLHIEKNFKRGTFRLMAKNHGAASCLSEGMLRDTVKEANGEMGRDFLKIGCGTMCRLTRRRGL